MNKDNILLPGSELEEIDLAAIFWASKKIKTSADLVSAVDFQ